MRKVTDRNIKDIFLANGFKEKPQADGAYNLNDYVFEAARALLEFAAAPVPPAGDVEVLAWNCNGHNFSSQAHAESYQRWMEGPTPITFLVDRSHVTRLTAELALERTRADVAVADCNDAEAAGKKVSKLLADRTVERDDLKVEVERLTTDRDYCKRVATHNKEIGEQAQSELTKARELLAAQGKVIEWATLIDKQAFAKGTQNVGVTAFRAMGDALVELRAHQSAPAAKDGE